jgi:phospholipid/cholesterol/gamma-HCH transport system permease protein
MTSLLAPVAITGRTTLDLLSGAGRIALFGVRGMSHVVRPPFYGRLFFRAFVDFAYFSLPVVAMTAVFSGMVIALQSYTGFARYGATNAIAYIVLVSVVRELAPVLAGLMVAGRVGAALTTLSTNPMKYLVAPRLLAGLLALPLLVVVADILGVAGGWLVATAKLGFNSATYLANSVNFLETSDVVVSLAKAAVFGFIVALMGCYHGYHSRGGAEGVGAATTSAVVSASILILAFDYVLTELFFAR